MENLKSSIQTLNGKIKHYSFFSDNQIRIIEIAIGKSILVGIIGFLFFKAKLSSGFLIASGYHIGKNMVPTQSPFEGFTKEKNL
jgi:hypothetical protein